MNRIRVLYLSSKQRQQEYNPNLSAHVEPHMREFIHVLEKSLTGWDVRACDVIYYESL